MQKASQAMEPAQVRTLAQRIEDRMLIIISGRESGGHSPELRAAYGAHLRKMRRQLGANAHTDMLELLLIERVVLCWLKLQWVEEQSTFTLGGGSAVVMAEQWDKRLDSAHSRSLRAAVTLERVRKLRRRTDQSEPVGDAIGEIITRGLRQARGLPE
jgi:hypothetical protein